MGAPTQVPYLPKATLPILKFMSVEEFVFLIKLDQEAFVVVSIMCPQENVCCCLRKAKYSHPIIQSVMVRFA